MTTRCPHGHLWYRPCEDCRPLAFGICAPPFRRVVQVRLPWGAGLLSVIMFEDEADDPVQRRRWIDAESILWTRKLYAEELAAAKAGECA